jgi:hypothetical protein
MRGRLINRFLADIARLDTEASAADPDGAGPETSGYDDDFREPVVIDVDDGDVTTNVRGETRQEQATITVPCQVETAMHERLNMAPGGNIPDSRMNLVFHFCDLEQLGLIDDDGNAKLKINDRLVQLRRVCGDQDVEQKLPSGGLYATHVFPTAFGIGQRKNLLVIQFDDREQSVEP